MGELIVNGIKWAFIIGVASTFMVAIGNLLNLITSIVFGSVIGEILAIASMCLPFDSNAVFGSISTILVGILSFMVARKLYNLYNTLKP